jgi:thiamine-phosphate pyrophosphorylase
MGDSCLLYYITDRKAFPGNEETQRRRLLDKIGEACRAGIDYIQLREKDLAAREIEMLAREAVRVVRGESRFTSVKRPPVTFLINSRTDVALAVNAGGVHLTGDDVCPEDLRKIWRLAAGSDGEDGRGSSQSMRISVSCHSVQEVMRAASAGADLALLAPIFEKKDVRGMRPQGLDALREAARAEIAVLALGGVTLQNAESCLRAGAAGVAGIRLFQENDVVSVVRALRAM